MHKLTNEQSRRMSELLNDVTGTSRQTLFEEALQMGRDSLMAELAVVSEALAEPAGAAADGDLPPGDVPTDSAIVPAAKKAAKKAKA